MSLISSAGLPQPSLAWQFEGTTTDYVTGLAPTGTIGSFSYTAGKYGQSIIFNGSSSMYFTLPLQITTGGGAACLFWVYPTAVSYSGGNQYYFWIGGAGGAGASGFGIGLNAFQKVPVIYFTTGEQISFSSPLVQNSWQHIAVVLLPGKTAAIYYNGVISGTISFSIDFPLTYPNLAQYTGGGSKAFCQMDDLRIFNKALTANQVQDIYAQGGAPNYPLNLQALPQPSLAWQFESSNVDSVTGLSPSSTYQAGTAYLQGTAALVTNAPTTSNTAVSFPGTSGSYMLLNSTSATFDLATSNLFVECWVYFSSLATSFQCIVADGPTGSGVSQECWVIRINSSTAVDFIINSTSPKTATSSTTISTGQWYHIAASYNSGASTGYVFVNGGTPNSVSSVTPKSSTGASLTMGAYPSPSSTVFMNGYIRDLRVIQGGIVPTTGFTVASAPFSYSLPSYVTGSGSVVFTLLGQFITYVPGLSGQALYINNSPGIGSPNCSVAYSLSSLPFTDVAPGSTVTLWVNPDNVTIGAFQVILGMSLGGIFYDLYIYNNNKLTFFGQGFSGGNIGIQYSPSLTAGTWYHLALVMLSGTVSFYVNGSLVGSGTFTNSTNFNAMSLGKHISNGANAFEGKYDDLRIYPTALSASQVQVVYAQGGSPPSSLRTVPPQPSLAWQFESSNVDYVTGLAPSSTLGTPTYVPGKYGQAIRFVQTDSTGATAQTGVTYNYSFNLTQFTICFWFNTTSINSQNNTTLFFVQTNYTSGTNGVFMILGSGVNNNLFLGGNGPYTSLTNTTTPLALNTWNHCAVVIDVSGSVIGYINGILSITGTMAPCSATSFYLANRPGVWGYNGAMDDLRIFNKALTAAQVQAVYNAQGVPSRGDYIARAPQPSLAWQFESSNVDSVTGLTPTFSTVNGSITSIPSYVPGIYGQAIYFNNQNSLSLGTLPSNSYMTYNLSSLNLTTNNFTFSFWIYLLCSFPYPTANQNFIDIVDSQTSYDIDINAGSVSNRRSFFYSPAYGVIQTTNDFQVNVWNHCTAVLSNVGATGFNTIVYYYVNGVLQGSGTISKSGTSVVSTMILGCGRGGGTIGYNGVWGYMDDLRIFNKALTTNQVQAVYNAQGMPSQQALLGTPLFSQLSTSATASAVGAFSLRAVNGTTARAVNVVAGGTFPVKSFTQTASGLTTYTEFLTLGILSGQYTATSSAVAFGCNAGWGFLGNASSPPLWQVNTYPSGGGTVSTPTTTTTGATNYNGDWVQLQLPYQISLTGYSASTLFTGTFVLLGSTTGTASSWTLIDTQSPNGSSTVTKTGLNVSAYNYLRFVIISSVTFSYPGLYNIKFYGTVPSLSSDFWADRLGNLLTAPVTGQKLVDWLGGATGYVTTWYDQSGKGNHATQATAANQPIIQRATKGPGYSAVFSGSQNLTYGTVSTFANTPFSVCAAVRRSNGNNRNAYAGWGDTGPNVAWNANFITPGDSITFSNRGPTTSSTIPVWTSSEGMYYITHTLSNNYYANNYVNGASAQSNWFSFLSPATTNNAQIGRTTGQGTPNTFYGEIFEFIAFTQSLYDLDNTGGLITQIYQNQLSYTGS